jgi:hypothetical protein
MRKVRDKMFGEQFLSAIPLLYKRKTINFGWGRRLHAFEKLPPRLISGSGRISPDGDIHHFTYRPCWEQIHHVYS